MYFLAAKSAVMNLSKTNRSGEHLNAIRIPGALNASKNGLYTCKN